MKPPADIEPGKLFRSLIRRPRPIARVDHQIYGLEQFELWATALTSYEIQCANDDGGMLAVAAESLVCEGERAFSSDRELATLGEFECNALLESWSSAFSNICPSMISADSHLWDEKLRKGVQDPFNFSVVLAMSECCDVLVGSTIVRTPRPGRYYGLPVAELTDGQRMAFSAATKFVNEQIESATKE